MGIIMLQQRYAFVLHHSTVQEKKIMSGTLWEMMNSQLP